MQKNAEDFKELTPSMPLGKAIALHASKLPDRFVTKKLCGDFTLDEDLPKSIVPGHQFGIVFVELSSRQS